jgi:hypothetical protein
MIEYEADPFGLTVIRAHGRRLSKLIRPDGAGESYDQVRTVDLHSTAAGDLRQLAALLHRLAQRPDCAVVRGVIADPRRTRGVRRLLHRDPESGDMPTLRDAARSWIALDLDGMPLPIGTDPRDLVACGEAARRALPAAFHDAACVIAATASHCIKPGARLRLWVHLSRPLDSSACQRWLRGAPACDPSTLRAAQIIYTAAPLFVGCIDPLPSRLAHLPGHATVVVPSQAALAPPPPGSSPAQCLTVPPDSRYALAALSRAAIAIATAGVDTRHATAVGEAWGLARLVRAGVLTEGEVVRVVDGALQQAGKPAGEGAAVAQWAIRRRSDAGPSGHRGNAG